MATIEELRALLAKTTKGPWIKPFEDGAICSAWTPNESLLALDKDDMAVVDKPADAALIVGMRNSYEALLDVAEAAQRCADETSIAGAGDKWRDVLTALAKLSAGSKEPTT